MKQLMLKIVAVFLLMLSSLPFVFANADWKEKDQFHAVMSQTFHPVEEGNFKPIRERSDEMLTKALAWQKSSIPKEFKKQKDIKLQLDKLALGAKSLRVKIQQGVKDEVIKADLTALHDVFHEIVGLCKE